MNSTPRLSTKTCLVFLFSCFLVLRLYVVFNQPVGFDEGLYGYLAHLTKTQSPYLDFFTGKTPGTFYLGSLVQTFDQSIFALRILSVVFQFLTVLAFYYLCQKFISQRAALLATALFTFDSFLVLNSSYFITENFYLFFMVLSLVFYLSSKNFVSGFLIGLSFLFKQNGAVLLLVFPLIEITSKKPFTQTIRRLLTLGLGFLAVFAPFLLWWILKLDLQQFFIFLVKANSWNVTQALPDLLRNRRDVVLGQMTFSMPLIVLSVLGVLQVLRSRKYYWLLIWFFCLSLFLFIIIKGYTYMFIPLYVPAAIFAGLSLERVLKKISYSGFLLAFLFAMSRIIKPIAFLSPSKMLIVSIGLWFVSYFLANKRISRMGVALFFSSLVLFTVDEYAIVTRQLRQGAVLLDDQQRIARIVSENTSPEELVYATNPGMAVLANREMVPIDVTYSGISTFFYGLPNYLSHKVAKFDLQSTLRRGNIGYVMANDSDERVNAWVNLKGDFELLERVGANNIYVRTK